MDSCVRIVKGMLAQERRSGRVVMGYLLGFAIMAFWMRGFLRYAVDSGEPVNILETFCVVEQYYINLLFLVLGWLLVIADAPFIKGNSYLLLYRCGRQRWNLGMLFYLLVQAFFYTAAMAAFTIAISSFQGFAGEIWSSPLYVLATDMGNQISARYYISFPWKRMMQTMTVPEAFAVTFLFLYLYLAFLGMLLYVCNLSSNKIAGNLVTLCIHLSGYLPILGGYKKVSLPARAVPGNFIDGKGGHWSCVFLFIVLIAVLMVLSAAFIQKADFRDRAGVDG